MLELATLPYYVNKHYLVVLTSSQRPSVPMFVHPNIQLSVPTSVVPKFSVPMSVVPKSIVPTSAQHCLNVVLKGGYSIIFASNVFHNSHLIQNCIQNQQLLLILYTCLNQMRVVKNIRRKDHRMNSL